MAAVKPVSETSRARETFRYSYAILKGIQFADSVHGAPNPESLRTSSDPVLTALAQLAACRLGTSRTLVSLFDDKYQYIVAEATPTLRLAPGLGQAETGEGLLLCGTAIPRDDGVCEHMLHPGGAVHCGGVEDDFELPVTAVADLSSDPRFSSKPACQPAGPFRFYSATPIRTRRGINIGVVCAVNGHPGVPNGWDENSRKIMRDLSHAIMTHLELTRTKGMDRRNERMIRGIGSFVQGKSTISGWRSSPDATFYDDSPGLEGALNTNQQLSQDTEEADQDAPFSTGLSDSRPSMGRSLSGPPRAQQEFDENGLLEFDVPSIFSKAANMIRESIEVEGVLFVDATVSAFGGLSTRADANDATQYQDRSQSSTSSDEDTRDPTFSQGPTCRILGFSTSNMSSIDGAQHSPSRYQLPEKFIAKLLRRYPGGKIFNFDQNGTLQSSDSAEDAPMPVSPVPAYTQPTQPPLRDSVSGRGGRQSPRRIDPFVRQYEGAIISKAFPGASSVAFVPVWNPRKERWFAGGFAFTCSSMRSFTVEGELSYLSAFSVVAMAQTFTHEASAVDRAKTNLLGSLSHELRSPLHGVMLGIELLQDTKLDLFQGKILHTLETCSRTLVDTLDHLLEYSKINNASIRAKLQIGPSSRGRRRGETVAIEDGIKSLSSDLRLDTICEEVMESVFAGFSLQNTPSAEFGMAAAKTPTSPQNVTVKEGVCFESGRVTVFLDFDPTCDWRFHAEPGSLRRVVMNLIGNSLKYTRSGTIRIFGRQNTTARPDDAARGVVAVELGVVDTGKGIGEEYLRHDLFSPFSQEDRLTPGTGLGLSLVKQIVSQLGGRISVSSRVGVGTAVSVSLPLAPWRRGPRGDEEEELGKGQEQVQVQQQVQQQEKEGKEGSHRVDATHNGDDDRVFEAQLASLKGLRVKLVGFEDQAGRDVRARPALGADDGLESDKVLMQRICETWLGMETLSEKQWTEQRPDLILASQTSLPYLTHEKDTADPPTVIICNSAFESRQLSTSPEYFEKPGVFEFISQPVGPRKLAKILHLAIEHWAILQDVPATKTLNSTCIPEAVEKSGLVDQPRMPLTLQTPLTALRLRLPPNPDVESASPDLALAPKPTFPPNRQLSQQQPAEERTTGSNNSKEINPNAENAAEQNLDEDEDEDDADDDATACPIFLLVDDNHINLKILAQYIERLGCTYDTAMHGREAVERFRARDGAYRCVLMDISMPVMDGFEATRHIRAFEDERRREGGGPGRGPGRRPSRATAVFALSGLSSSDAQEEAFRSGIDLFLSKPVKLKELKSIFEIRGIL